jgi:two-component system sensor histidine kinase DctS
MLYAVQKGSGHVRYATSTMASPLSINPELLELDFGQTSALNRRTQIWLGVLLILVLVSTVMLALFLQTEENREKNRQRAEDTEWLEQSLSFHFHRLESDLAAMAQEVRHQGQADAELPRSGSLWRGTGVITAQGWVAPGKATQAFKVSPETQGLFDVMLDTARALQRPWYAGPLQPAGSGASHQLWLAVPVFEQGDFAGRYVAVVNLEKALEAALPAWFLQDHHVQLQGADNAIQNAGTFDPLHYVVPVNLNGAELKLQVDVLTSRPQTAPRAFFGIALFGLIGMLLALYLFFRDTVKRVGAESQLKAQIAIRTAMERSVTLGLRAWDLEGKLLYVNQAFCRLVDWDAASLLTHDHPPPYWPAEQGDEFADLQDVMDHHETHAMGAERRLITRDGHTLEVLMHYAPLTLVNGTAMGWICSTLDITERRHAERQALHQQERLEASARLIVVGEVASTLAHELNQPLGALSSFSNGLLNRIRGGNITLDEVSPVVERMEKLAEKAGRVIQRVNAFARRQEMSKQTLELVSFVRRVVHAVSLPANIEMNCDFPATPCTVEADALLLEHAIHNLVLNATEWAAHNSAAQGMVTIHVVLGDNVVGIAVEDSGPGVPPDKRSAIFNAFTSHKGGGMGMGLSICRSIVEAHNGRIEVGDSATLGGAQFTLWLPLGTPTSLAKTALA